MGRLMGIGLVVLLVPVAAHAGRALGDAELRAVVGLQDPDLWACTDYECSTPVACHCDEALDLCVWKQVKPGRECQHPGTANICMSRLFYNDCYRVGTHTPDHDEELHCICAPYCADPNTGWSWTAWMGDRRGNCMDNATGP
jgi:hypothetical protein